MQILLAMMSLYGRKDMPGYVCWQILALNEKGETEKGYSFEGFHLIIILINIFIFSFIFWLNLFNILRQL